MGDKYLRKLLVIGMTALVRRGKSKPEAASPWLVALLAPKPTRVVTVAIANKAARVSEAQMRRIEPYFPLSHGVPRVDDRRIISGIIFVIRNGLRWRDAPAQYGPPKTIYNRFIRWSRLGVFNKIFAALASKGGKPDQLMIDATHLKAHRTAASLLKKGMFPDVSVGPKVV